MRRLRKLKKTRKARVRAKILGRTSRPRLSVFVSNQHIYAQIIDDKMGKTQVAAKDKDVDVAGKTKEVARRVGELLAQRAKKAKITNVVFDRGGYKYHGRVAALAEGARKGGLRF